MSERVPDVPGEVWGVPDIGFSHAQLTAARTVLAGWGVGPELAFLGGDRATGLGRVDATVDLYVVGGTPSDVQREVDGTTVRVHTLTVGQVAEPLAMARGYRATSVRSPQLAATDELVRALLRVVTGHRLVVGGRWAAELDAVDENTVRQLVISRSALAFAAAADEVFDALLSGDLFTSVTASEQALLAGCQAALAAAGDLHSGGKFVFRRLARTAATAPWCGLLWRLLNGMFPPADMPAPTEVRAIVEQRLLVGNLLLSFCALEGWGKRLPRLPEPAELSCRSLGAGPWRSAYFTPVRFADALALRGPRQGYQVTEGVLRLWRWLDGRDQAAVARRLAQAEPTVAGMSLPALETAIGALHEVGAVGLPSTQLRRSGLPRPSLPVGRPELAIRPSVRFDTTPRADGCR